MGHSFNFEEKQTSSKMSTKISKAFEEGSDEENDEYGKDEFEEVEGRVAATQAATSGKSILAQAAAQAAAETRVEVQAVLHREAVSMEEEEETGKNTKDKSREEREKSVPGTAHSKLGEEDSSDDEDEGADGDAEENIALRVACWKGEANKAENLLDKGADLRAKDRHGWTALHWACKIGDTACIEVLVKSVKRAQGKVTTYINTADTLCGWTALHVACIHARKDAVQALVGYGARINKINFMKELPVECIPASARNLKLIKRLLGVVDPSEKHREGESKECNEEKSSREEKR